MKLGDKVRDTVTCFEGFAVAMCDYLWEEDSVGIEAPRLVDGKPIGIKWFSRKRVEVIPDFTPQKS